MLIGIVLRGSAFTFRSYDRKTDDAAAMGRVFSMTSLITPVLLGGRRRDFVRADSGRVFGFRFGLRLPWLAPFPFAVGFFALAQFAFLAAVYLTVEARDEALREDFRLRALASAVAVGDALAVFLLAENGAPVIRHRLTRSWWTWPLQIPRRSSRSARSTRCGRDNSEGPGLRGRAHDVDSVGWGAAQYPYLIVPDVTIYTRRRPAITLRLVWWALLAGSALLFPSLYYLFRVFKRGRAT